MPRGVLIAILCICPCTAPWYVCSEGRAWIEESEVSSPEHDEVADVAQPQQETVVARRKRLWETSCMETADDESRKSARYDRTCAGATPLGPPTVFYPGGSVSIHDWKRRIRWLWIVDDDMYGEDSDDFGLFESG